MQRLALPDDEELVPAGTRRIESPRFAIGQIAHLAQQEPVAATRFGLRAKAIRAPTLDALGFRRLGPLASMARLSPPWSGRAISR
ncbi:MAG: hypothetical protein M0R28_09155 [Pigmentiphaga sp.]|nr:hypothetical protein [Pigmentiphaga sp.]